MIPKIKAGEDDLLDENKNDMKAFRRAFTRALHRLTNSQDAVIYEAGDTKLAEVIKLRRSVYEEEMKKGLGNLGYAIKGPFDLALIAGQRRIESVCNRHHNPALPDGTNEFLSYCQLQYVLPLLYLLLEHHYENLERGKAEASRMRFNSIRVIESDYQMKYIASAELEALTKSMVQVFAAVTVRVRTLHEMFIQQRLDPDQSFGNVAHGLLNEWHTFWWDRKCESAAQTAPQYELDDDDVSLTGSAPAGFMGTTMMEYNDEDNNDYDITAKPDGDNVYVPYDIAGLSGGDNDEDNADSEDANDDVSIKGTAPPPFTGTYSSETKPPRARNASALGKKRAKNTVSLKVRTNHQPTA